MLYLEGLHAVVELGHAEVIAQRGVAHRVQLLCTQSDSFINLI